MFLITLMVSSILEHYAKLYRKNTDSKNQSMLNIMQKITIVCVCLSAIEIITVATLVIINTSAETKDDTMVRIMAPIIFSAIPAFALIKGISEAVKAAKLLKNPPKASEYKGITYSKRITDSSESTATAGVKVKVCTTCGSPEPLKATRCSKCGGFSFESVYNIASDNNTVNH